MFLFQVELNRKYRMHDILTQHCVTTSTYINARTVFMRCTLHQGRYVIIPTTFKPQSLGDYMIRMFTDVESDCRYNRDVKRVNYCDADCVECCQREMF